MEKKSVGRNTKLTESEVRTVIKMYKANIQPMGNIIYSEIHSYANQLYAKGLVSDSTSDSFWRKDGRLGRIEVDKANAIFSETVTISSGKEIKVPNVVDLVNKKYKNKEDLLKHLIIMEKQFRDSLDREKKLADKISVFEGNLHKAKTDKEKVDEKNEMLQGLVYRLSRILSQTSNEEVQQQTKYAMKTVFSSPIEFLEFEERNKPKEEPKVVPFVNDEPKTRISNRFRKN